MKFASQRRQLKIGFYTAIVLSLLIHMGLVTGLLVFPHSPSKSDDRIEVQIMDPNPPNPVSKEKPQQVVEQDEKALNNEIDDKAKYLSAHNQKVLKQTAAKAHGEFQNTSSRSTSPGAGGQPRKIDLKDLAPKFDVAKSVHDRDMKEKQFDEDPDAVKIASGKMPQRRPQRTADANPGPGGDKISQTIDYIKDLDPGLETLLTTREFVYYTFYSRIRRQLNQFWGPKVKEKLIGMYHQGRQLASSDDKITRCLITLDKGGQLVKVQVIGVSGVHELDEAAVEAFKLAAPVPNPPHGIVDEDGTIKIRWDFILEV